VLPVVRWPTSPARSPTPPDPGSGQRRPDRDAHRARVPRSRRSSPC
jgi:hypothetical protein